MNKWIEVDASNRQLGRLATEVANLIIGKNNPDYQPNKSKQTNIVVINCQKVSANLVGKNIYSHSGYLGNLKTKPKSEVSLDKIVQRSILGMLPKNRLFKGYASKIHCYLADSHPYKGQIK